MFRPGLLFIAYALSSAVVANCAPDADAQSSQYPAQQNAQLALVTPSAPDGMQMLRLEASVLFSGGNYLAASENYRRLLQLGSMDANDRYWLGESLYHANNFKQAATAFDQAVQLNPKLQQAYVRLTETYLALHQKDKAAQICSTGLNVVTDIYMKSQLSNLMRVAVHQDQKQVRSPANQPNRMPSES